MGFRFFFTHLLRFMFLERLPCLFPFSIVFFQRVLANLCYSPVHFWTCVCNFSVSKQFIPCIFLMLLSDAITNCKWRNTKDWKVTEKYSHHNTPTTVSATPRHFLFWARLLESRSFTFSLAYSFRPLQVVVRHYLFFAVERASRWVSQ